MLYSERWFMSTTVAPSVCGLKCPPGLYRLKRRWVLTPHARHTPCNPPSWNRSPGCTTTSGTTCSLTRRQSSSATAALVISTVSEFRNVAVDVDAFQKEYSAASAHRRSAAHSSADSTSSRMNASRGDARGSFVVPGASSARGARHASRARPCSSEA